MPVSHLPEWIVSGKTDSAPALAPVRVAFLLASSGLGGGELLLLSHLANADRRRLCPALVCCSEGPMTQRVRALGIEVLVAPMEQTYDIRHLKMPYTKTLLTVRAALRRWRTQLIHSYTFETHAFAHPLALLCGLPLLHTSQDTVFGGVFKTHEWWFLNHFAHRVILTSRAVGHSLRLGERLQSSRSRHVMPGIATARFVSCPEQPTLRLSFGFAPGDLVVGAVARLCSVKGWDTFLACAARLRRSIPNVRFLIVGDAVLPGDDYGQHVPAEIERLGLGEAVVCTGFRDDVPALMRCMDVLVSASPRESFGLVLVEAGAAARPVVSVRNGGAQEIVVDGVTGVLVPVDDATALADAVAALLADPPELRRMGQRAQRHVVQHFDIARMVQELDVEYAAVMRETGGRVPLTQRLQVIRQVLSLALPR
jgi:glycosyltransferase involved in cell wall biosynthesis